MLTKPKAQNYFAIANPRDLAERANELRAAISRDGLVVIKLWDATEDSLLALAKILGRVQAHPTGNANGVVEVTPSANNLQKQMYFGEVSSAFEPHTDGSFLQGVTQYQSSLFSLLPPSFVLLQSVQTADRGGESLAVDMNLIIETLLQKEPDILKILMDPMLVAFKRGKDGIGNEPIVKITSPTTAEVRFRFDALHVKEGYEDAILQFIQKYIFNPAYQTQFLLQPSEVAIFDNRRIFHGRSPIEDKNAESKRHLRRLWIWNENAREFRKLKLDVNSKQTFSAPLKYLKDHYLPLTTEKFLQWEDLPTGIQINPQLFFALNRRRHT